METRSLITKMTNSNKNKISKIAIGIFTLFVVLYSLFQARNLILGPDITIESPVHGSTLSSALFEIRGKAKNVSSITLNDSPIFIDEHGVFKETLVAPPGYFIAKLSAQDKFGQTKTRYIELVSPTTQLEEKDILDKPETQI